MEIKKQAKPALRTLTNEYTDAQKQLRDIIYLAEEKIEFNETHNIHRSLTTKHQPGHNNKEQSLAAGYFFRALGNTYLVEEGVNPWATHSVISTVFKNAHQYMYGKPQQPKQNDDTYAGIDLDITSDKALPGIKWLISIIREIHNKDNKLPKNHYAFLAAGADILLPRAMGLGIGWVNCKSGLDRTSAAIACAITLLQFMLDAPEPSLSLKQLVKNEKYLQRMAINYTTLLRSQFPLWGKSMRVLKPRGDQPVLDYYNKYNIFLLKGCNRVLPSTIMGTLEELPQKMSKPKRATASHHDNSDESLSDESAEPILIEEKSESDEALSSEDWQIIPQESHSTQEQTINSGQALKEICEAIIKGAPYPSHLPEIQPLLWNINSENRLSALNQIMNAIHTFKRNKPEKAEKFKQIETILESFSEIIRSNGPLMSPKTAFKKTSKRIQKTVIARKHSSFLGRIRNTKSPKQKTSYTEESSNNQIKAWITQRLQFDSDDVNDDILALFSAMIQNALNNQILNAEEGYLFLDSILSNKEICTILLPSDKANAFYKQISAHIQFLENKRDFYKAQLSTLESEIEQENDKVRICCKTLGIDSTKKLNEILNLSEKKVFMTLKEAEEQYSLALENDQQLLKDIEEKTKEPENPDQDAIQHQKKKPKREPRWDRKFLTVFTGVQGNEESEVAKLMASKRTPEDKAHLELEILTLSLRDKERDRIYYAAQLEQCLSAYDNHNNILNSLDRFCLSIPNESLNNNRDTAQELKVEAEDDNESVEFDREIQPNSRTPSTSSSSILLSDEEHVLSHDKTVLTQFQSKRKQAQQSSNPTSHPPVSKTTTSHPKPH